METRENLKPLPPMKNHRCFGCGPDNPQGLQMEFFIGKELIYSWIKVPDHLCSWHNIVHGGVVSTMLDEVMGRTVNVFTKSLGLTRNINIELIKTAFIGDELRAEGQLIEIINLREAKVKAVLYNSHDEICAKSTATFALVSPDKIRKSGVDAEEVLEWFENNILRLAVGGSSHCP